MSVTKSQIPVNVFWNSVVFLLNAAFGIFSIPFIISKLGVADYGILALITSVTNYLLFINVAFNSSISRYLTIDLANNDQESAIRTFNSSFFGNLFIIVCLLPVAWLVFYFLKDWAEIPESRSSEMSVLFWQVVIAFFATMIAAGFNASAFSLNRLDLKYMADAVYQFLRIFLLFFLFLVFTPSIKMLGLVYFCAAVGMVVTSWYVWKKLTPYLRLNVKTFDWKTFRKLSGFSKWILFDQIGTLILYNSELLLVNRYFGNEEGGRYASVLQFAFLIRSVVAVLAAVLTPIMLSFYAKKEYDRLYLTSLRSVKVISLVIAGPIGILIGFSAPLLRFWLGEEFQDLSFLVLILLAHLAVNLAVMPLFPIQVAFEKVKVPSLVTLISGLLAFPLAFICMKMFAVGPWIIGVVFLFTISLKNILFTTFYVSRLQKKPVTEYFKQMLPSFIMTPIFIVVSFAITRFFPTDNFFVVAFLGISTALVYYLFAWKVFVSEKEKEFYISFLPERFRRRFN